MLKEAEPKKQITYRVRIEGTRSKINSKALNSRITIPARPTPQKLNKFLQKKHFYGKKITLRDKITNFLSKRDSPTLS